MLTNYTAKDVIWDGVDIPCLGICHGATISEVMYKVATKVCDLCKELDFNTLDYSCIIDKSKIVGDVDIYLLFSILLKNDCDIRAIIDAKLDELNTTELLVNSLDLKCFLQQYLDSKCTIIRFYNQLTVGAVDPNVTGTVFQKAEVATEGYYYVSDVDQRVWEWNGVIYVLSSIQNLSDVPDCICELKDLDLDVLKVYQILIDNLCQTKSSGVIKACDTNYATVVFDTIDPNLAATNFIGLPSVQTSYYISSVDHKIWRWVISQGVYLPSLLTSSNIALDSLDACLLNAEIFLQNWLNLYQIYQEPSITSCLSSVPTIFSNHVIEITDSAICELQNNVGTQTQLDQVLKSPCLSPVSYFRNQANSPGMNISNNPNDLTYFYISVDYPNDPVYVWNGSLYVPYKRNIAQLEKDQWDKVCDLLYRVKVIETTCCTPTCDNTTIGFSAVYNSEDNIFTLTFDSASGTNISEDFTDCGSVLTATDSKGTSFSIPLELVQDYSVELDVATLDISKPVTINIKSCLSNGTLTCKNCSSSLLPIIELCGICKLCAVDNSDTGTETVQVFYTLASNPSSLQSITLKGGQCLTFSLPEDTPTIKSIITSSSSIALESDPTYPCNDIQVPAAVADTCWFFEIPLPTSLDIVLDSTTGVPLSNIGNLFFKLSPTYSHSPTYNKYYDYSNTSGTPLSGTIINLASLSDTITSLVTPKIPINLPNSVKSVTLCSGVAQIDIDNYPGLPGPGGVVIALGVISPQQELTYTETLVNNRFGYVFKIQGQPTNLGFVQQPEIAIKDPVSNAITYIKGELLSDECDCPS